MTALRAVGRAFAQIFTHFTVALLSNIAAFVLSLPLLLIVGIVAYPSGSWSLIPVGVALLIGTLPNPMSAGLQCTARKLAQGENVDLRDQIAQLRQFALPALKCWLAGLAGTALIVVNLTFYSHSRLIVAGSLQVFWLFVLWLWVCVHLYVYPLLLNQEVKTVLAVYRNAIVMVVARPLFTFMIVAVWITELLFSAGTGLTTIIGLAFGASIQQNAFALLVPTFQKS